MRLLLLLAVPLGISACAAAYQPVQPDEGTMRVLPMARYHDKARGAWAGQMIGVCYGAPYEFKSLAKPITGPLEPWTPERVHGAIDQDDCYVEMTFLEALEEHGLDITLEQAGRSFAESQFPLWHANRFAREQIRHGILPPDSGHPRYNPHADDIDFQIEADLFGILCPGLPQESNRLCDVFGHVMNYGDGVYGGMFVAGMYSAAWFEETNVKAVVDSGLKCIPKKSAYARSVQDVIDAHHRNPDDWLEAWRIIEDRWQDDVDCTPDKPFNIDAKLNGAYIVIGLLYGEGDFLKTMKIATRCGQDADCNASSAAGILGCMKGFDALGEEFTGGIAAIADANFAHTRYSFNTLIPACQAMTEKILARSGGRIEGEGADARMLIPMQKPRPARFEQWDPAQKRRMVREPDPPFGPRNDQSNSEK